MDTIYTAPLATRRIPRATVRAAIASTGSIVVEALMEGIRGESFQRAFASAPDAQFSALPSASKERLLNRGFRP